MTVEHFSRGSSYCKPCNNQRRKDYTARKAEEVLANEPVIVLVPESEFDPQELASTYDRDVDWIKRSLMACRNAGTSEKYFVDRYLKKLDIPFDKDVDYQARLVQGLIRE